MDKDWTLREELYKAFHQWPSLIGFFAIGCLLGFLGSFIKPSYHRATNLIYVGLNPYRAYSDSIFLALASPKYGNLDDYKNWQMSQLESVIFLDDFLDSTLDLLRQEDSYWENVKIQELREILIAEWRNTGTWKLSAEHPEELRALQASSAWSQVAIERVKTAVEAAREISVIDQELKEITNERIHSERRIDILNSTRKSLEELGVQLQAMEPGDSLPHQKRELLYATVANSARLTPAWTNLLNSYPGEDAPIEFYSSWVQHATATIEAEMPILEEQIQLLVEKQTIKEQEYNNVANASLGISANISIEGISEQPVQKIRSSSQSTLIGGILGIFVWILTQTIRVARKDFEK